MAYAKKLKELMNIIILYAQTKVHIYKGWNKINFHTILMYFEVRRDGVGGWAEILLSDQNSQNETIIVLTVTFVLVIMDEVFIYQYIVNNNTFILLVFLVTNDVTTEYIVSRHTSSVLFFSMYRVMKRHDV